MIAIAIFSLLLDLHYKSWFYSTSWYHEQMQSCWCAIHFRAIIIHSRPIVMTGAATQSMETTNTTLLPSEQDVNWRGFVYLVEGGIMQEKTTQDITWCSLMDRSVVISWFAVINDSPTHSDATTAFLPPQTEFLLSKWISTNLPKRLLLLLRTVFALPNASSNGVAV